VFFVGACLNRVVSEPYLATEVPAHSLLGSGPPLRNFV
jgi:hypothetical protein